MNRIYRIVRITLVALTLFGVAAPGLTADKGKDAVVASGKMDGRFLASSLFHIDEFWMRVASGTDFHRWLSDGLGRPVVIRLASDTARVGDDKTVRILSGTLVHETVPKPTPADVDVVGRLPEGNSGFVHVYFVRAEIAGTTALSAVTFETADAATVAKFSAFEGAHVNIVIEIH